MSFANGQYRFQPDECLFPLILYLWEEVVYANSVIGNNNLLRAGDVVVPFLLIKALTALSKMYKCRGLTDWPNEMPLTVYAYSVKDGVFVFGLLMDQFHTMCMAILFLSDRKVNFRFRWHDV